MTRSDCPVCEHPDPHVGGGIGVCQHPHCGRDGPSYGFNPADMSTCEIDDGFNPAFTEVVREWWVEKNMDNEPWASWCVMGAWEDEFSGGSFCHSSWSLRREARAELAKLK